MTDQTTRAEEGAKSTLEDDLYRVVYGSSSSTPFDWHNFDALTVRVKGAEARAALAEAEVERLTGLVEDWKATAEAEAEIGNERAATAQTLRDRVAVLESALTRIAGSRINDWDSLRPDECPRVARAALKEPAHV